MIHSVFVRGSVPYNCGTVTFNSCCTLGQAHGSQSHQKRAFRFCLTKLLWHADVINDSVMLSSKPSNNDSEGNIWTERRISGYVTSPRHSSTAFHGDLWITYRYFALCAMHGSDWAPCKTETPGFTWGSNPRAAWLVWKITSCFF